MDESLKKQGWLFDRCGDSYIAVWCSSGLIPYDDVIIGGEYRAYADRCGWICRCGSKDEMCNFDRFKSQGLESVPTIENVKNKFVIQYFS